MSDGEALAAMRDEARVSAEFFALVRVKSAAKQNRLLAMWGESRERARSMGSVERLGEARELLRRARNV